MDVIEQLRSHSSQLGSGVDPVAISDLEARLDIDLPPDFKKYLRELNYAEIFGDPIFGIRPDDDMLDIYKRNKYQEHFRYGFLIIFANDIDGAIYLRPDSGAAYTPDFGLPVATSFSDYVDKVLAE